MSFRLAFHRSVVSFALLALASASACACAGTSTGPQACTEIGCGSAFSVAFQHAGAWKAGSYTVDVTLDGVKSTCAATLPLSCSAPAPCPTGSKIILGLSGCALDPSQHSLSGVDFEQGAAPSSVEIAVSLDGALLAKDTFTPTYTKSRPNGEGCDPECNSAPSASLTLP